MRLYLLFLILFCCTSVKATDFITDLTPRQVYLLKIARDEGAKIGFPWTVQAILWQESHAGRFGPVGDGQNKFGKRSYCPMQIKLGTAKDVLKYMKRPWDGYDEELLTKLLTDDKFCIMLGANYFKMKHDRFKDWNKAVLAYNQGPGGVYKKHDPNDYVAKVSELIKTRIKSFNEFY